MRPISLCLLALLALVFPVAASADDAPTLSGADSDPERTMHGTVDAVSDVLVSRWLRANPHRDLTLHLDSRGGKAIIGAKLYDAIRAQGRVATDVAAGQMCLSSCTYLWLAGRARTVADHAVLGFHSASCEGRCDLRGVGLINQSLLDILARTEPSLAVLVSRTGAMISGNTLLALARRDGTHWTMQLYRPPPERAAPERAAP